MDSQDHKTRTLWLAGALHAFTHVYQVALLPLYLPIQADFKLQSVGQATLLVTVLMIAYFVPSYPMGILADRFSRKKLLGYGLLINALGFIALAFAHTYTTALLAVIVSGVGGSFYHPAATALVARLYPVGTGKALGLTGVGASIGFFFGPIYSGWRTETLTASLGAAAWRQPVLELGVLGIIAAGLFAWLAQTEQPRQSQETKSPHSNVMFATPTLWLFFIAASFCFSLRDFAGSSMGSLGSLFLQNAHGYTVEQTGLALSGIFVASIVSNPLFGHLSDRGRKRWTCVALITAAILVAIFPHVPRSWVIPTYLIYGFFFLANYPMVEAALMESVPDSVRGRVFGLFITIGGLVGNLSHWLVGQWVEGLGERASSPTGYYRLYVGLAALMICSLAGLLCLHAIRKREEIPIGKLASPSPLRALDSP